MEQEVGGSSPPNCTTFHHFAICLMAGHQSRGTMLSDEWIDPSLSNLMLRAIAQRQRSRQARKADYPAAEGDGTLCRVAEKRMRRCASRITGCSIAA